MRVATRYIFPAVQNYIMQNRDRVEDLKDVFPKFLDAFKKDLNSAKSTVRHS